MDTKIKKVSSKRDTLPPREAEILDLLKKNPTVTSLIEVTGRDKGNVYKSIRKLLKRGLIVKIEKGIYKGVLLSGGVPPRCPLFRLHNLQIKLKVADFNHRIVKETLIRNKQYYNHRESATGDYMDFGGVTGLLTSESLFFYWPSNWELKAQSFNELAPEVYNLIEETVKRWEEKFKLQLFKDGRVNFEICNGHVAFEQEDVARTFKVNRITGYILKDKEDGKARFIIDMSKGFVEVELVHPNKFLMDTEKVDYWAQTLIDGTFKQAVEIAKQTPIKFEELKAELKQETIDLSEQAIQTTQVMGQINNNVARLTKEFIELKAKLRSL